MSEFVRGGTPIDPIDSFLEKVKVVPEGCWEWQGATTNGYGVLSVNGETTLAHRFGYETFSGEKLDGHETHHVCRKRDCVFPLHVTPMVPKEHARLHVEEDRKTHCIHGHRYTPDNTYVNPKTGHRSCKKCRKAAMRRYYKKRAEG